jgi:acyl-CoA dehydrogenase
MDFAHSEKVRTLQQRLNAFMDQHIYPNEAAFDAEVEANRKKSNVWQPTKVIDELKEKAKAEGLWNLFLPESKFGAGLTNLEYAPLCEIMGRSPIAPRSSTARLPTPATWSAGALRRAGTPAAVAADRCWKATIRSAFAMTEPAVASSDATNIEASIERDGDHYVINGRKWWTSGAPIRAAGSSSSWARPARTTPTATSSSR